MRQFGICWKGIEQTYLDKIIETTTRFIGERFTYVEIGIAEGKTLSAVVEHLKLMNIEHSVFGVDKEDGWSLNREELEKNISEVMAMPTSTVNSLKIELCGSVNFLSAIRMSMPGKVHFMLIDGCHETECVMLDFLLAEDCMAKGGVICFHDTDGASQGIDIQPHHGQPIGVRQAIQKLGMFLGNPDWEIVLDIVDPPEGARGILMVKKIR